jgi:imidazoleglycerol-phosphate dehydratase
MTRHSEVERQTGETRIRVYVTLDGTGKTEVETPIGFLTHMVEQIARHGLLDIGVAASGDTHIDGHHTTEDLGVALGWAVDEALGDKDRIRRYGSATLPMDEACVTCAIDLSGRPHFVWNVPIPKARVGDFDTELAEVFFEAFARSAKVNLHFHLQSGENLHHIIEICFKAFARALREAIEIDPRATGVPSTKGTLEGG